MDYTYKAVLKYLNTPLILSKPILNLHKIFKKFTSASYYKYAFDLLDILCQKAGYEDKKRIHHLSFTYLTVILYNCGNIPYLSNFDLMILCCFNLSIKVIENQADTPFLNKIKNIYKEKFNNYKKEEIVKAELICIKLLNYKINIITPYECLNYLINQLYKDKDKNIRKGLLEMAAKELEQKLLNINDYMDKKPMKIANEIIEIVKNKRNVVNYPILLKRKIIPTYNHLKINKVNKNEKKNEKIIIEKYNNSYDEVEIFKYTNNMGNKNKRSINSKIVLNHKNMNVITNITKQKKKIYNKPISLLLLNPGKNVSIFDKRTVSKDIKRNLVLNSSNIIKSYKKNDIELNSSIFNKTKYDSSSPNGSDGISSFIAYNNYGYNLNKYTSSRNVFKKPCLNKYKIKTYFTTSKKEFPSNNLKKDNNLSQECILEGDISKKLFLDKMKKKCFTNTSFLAKQENSLRSKIELQK